MENSSTLHPRHTFVAPRAKLGSACFKRSCNNGWMDGGRRICGSPEQTITRMIENQTKINFLSVAKCVNIPLNIAFMSFWSEADVAKVIITVVSPWRLQLKKM